MFTISRNSNPLFCLFNRFIFRISLLFIFSNFVIIKFLLRFLCTITGYNLWKLIPIFFLCGFQHFYKWFINTLVNLFTSWNFNKCYGIIIWERVPLIYECFESFLRNDEDLRKMFDFKYPITTPQEPMNPEVVTDPEKGVGYALFNYAEDEIGPGFLNQGKSLSPGINYGDRRAVSYQNNVAAVKAAYEANGYDNDKTLAALEGSAKSFFLDNYVNHGEVKGNSIATKNSLLNYEYISQAINDGVIQFDGGLGPWGLPLQEVTDYWGTLEAMEREYTHKIIKGEIPLDDFDKFVTEWKANGGDEILRAKNELYQQMTGN